MVRLGVRIYLTCCVVLYSTYVCAVGIPEKKPENWGAEQGGNMPLVELEDQQVIDDAQVEASALLYEVSEWIDSFFDDGRFTEEENESRATLKLSLGYSRHDEIEIQPRLDVRISLPKLSSRAQLVLEAAEDSDFDTEDGPSGYSNHDDGDRSEFRAALRWFLKEGETYNVSFDAGASWDYLYGSLRFRAIQDFDKWSAALPTGSATILMMAGRIVQPMTLRPILMRISFFAQPPLSTIMKPKMAFPTPSNSVCIRC
jgi:hypothetical protein